MNPTEFSDFPDHATVWVYPFAKPLDAAAKATIAEALDAFLQQWNAHGAEVQGAYAIVLDRFVMLSNRPETGVSGCSIDSSVRIFKALKAEHGLDGLARTLVYYQDGDQVAAIDRPGFQKLAEAGTVTLDTIVYDPAITTLGELRHGQFATAARNAWHARAFRFQAATA